MCLQTGVSALLALADDMVVSFSGRVIRVWQANDGFKLLTQSQVTSRTSATCCGTHSARIQINFHLKRKVDLKLKLKQGHIV